MALFENSPFGDYRGKLGKLTYYTRLGKNIVRTIGKIKRPPTLAQLKCRREMAVIVDFLKPIKEFVNVGFMNMAIGTNRIAYNFATSLNKMNALKGTYPDISIDYRQVILTAGKMQQAIDPAVELQADGLHFTWACPASLPWPRENDQVMLLAYFPELQKAVYLLYGAGRQQCSAVLALQPGLLNAYMEVYISFIAVNRNGIANSSYLGCFGKL